LKGSERGRKGVDSDSAFDLVITDLSIPNGMGGVKAIEEIRETDPGVIAIVSSGYSDDPAMANPEKYGYAAVLPKPYQPQDLARLVDLVLNGR
jgi:two-component system cell cycle sensor histidine kinase/response regulator CckA